jgi:acyl-homoserine lactone acylase PvdQ
VPRKKDKVRKVIFAAVLMLSPILVAQSKPQYQYRFDQQTYRINKVITRVTERHPEGVRFIFDHLNLHIIKTIHLPAHTKTANAVKVAITWCNLSGTADPLFELDK